jgi:hypothetical protein
MPEKTRAFSGASALRDGGAPFSERGPAEKEGLGVVGRGSGLGGLGGGGGTELVIALFSYPKLARYVAADYDPTL